MTFTSKRVFTNGRIFTSAADDGHLHAAMAVDGDKIVFVGDEEGALRAAGSDAAKSDLGGAVVLPGIIDAHTHLTQFGSALTRFDCISKSAKEVQELLKSYAAANPDAKMLLGKTFLFDSLGTAPHKDILDAVVSDRPVFIDSADLHSTWVNSAGLAAAGITEDTPDPKGGTFVRDADGKLTGLCLETASHESIWAYIARATTHEERVALQRDALAAYLAAGVTGVVDMATTEEELQAMEALYDAGELQVRVAAQWLVRPGGTDEDRANVVRQGDAHRKRLADKGCGDLLRIAGIKICSDGVVDSCTAFLTEPYANGSLPGPIWPADELNTVVVLADSLDMQVAVHAIGDAAIVQALDAFEVAVKTNGPKGRRHRIEHLEVVSQESIARLARLGVTASLQPVHADPVYVPNWRLMLGEDERCDRAFPWTEYFEQNAHVAFGSDAPTAPHFPLPNIYTATTRQSAIDPTLPPSEEPRIKLLERFCLSLETSIRCYTAGGAWSVRREKQYGSLAEGKSADFCVLDIDPFKHGVDTLREAQKAVTQTWIAGKKVWSKQ